jgi:murein DD-endopeptidase MepM/ murein hydrolase activator NlpD
VIAPNPAPAVEYVLQDRLRLRRAAVVVLALLAALAGPTRRADAATPDAVETIDAAASERALQSPFDAPLPYRETLRLDAGRPEALAYRLDVRRGERLTIAVDGPERADIALDLFEPTADGHRRLHGAAAGERSLAYEVGREQLLLLRVQAGLDVAGELTLTIRRGASLVFPVAGKDSRSVGSRFGAPRAGGKRTHHGVDIFVPRGATVLAGAGGEAWVGINNLGGNIIFVRDDERDVWLYYAHLDVQLVAHGARVERGEPIGRVGNTGNARTTAPHLHFGIYSRGPLDPYPFIHEPTSKLPQPSARQLAQLGARMRVGAARTRLLGGPTARSGRLRDLPRDTVFEVRGVHRDFLRVRLPDGTTGWLSSRAGRALTSPIRRLKLSEETAVRSGVEPSAPALGRAAGGERVAVLGAFGPALYVRTTAGLEGWI